MWLILFFVSDPRKWNSADVLRWLKDKDLEDFRDVFYANGFEGATLVGLSSSQFVAGGFKSVSCLSHMAECVCVCVLRRRLMQPWFPEALMVFLPPWPCSAS